MVALGTVAVPVGAAIVFILKLMFKESLSEANRKLLSDINGTYLRSTIANEKFSGIDEKFKVVHHRIDDLRHDGSRTAHSGG